MIELTPIRESKSDFDELQEIIDQLFKDEIYIPLMSLLKDKGGKIMNSLSDLISAIQSGKITYYRGKFKGKFSSTLSRELRKIGAEWDKKQGCFLIPQSKLSNEIRTAISSSESKFHAKIQQIVHRLTKIDPALIAEKLKVTDIFDSTLWKIEKKFEKSIQNITIAPSISDEQRKRIAAEYTKNMQLYVRNFAEKEIINLRESVEKEIFAGNRYESLIGKIQKSYGVSQNKAKFLARQETALLMAKYKQTRYQSAGIDEYKWRCVHNPKDKSPHHHTPGNVRYWHGLNDGKIFRWDTGAPVDKNGTLKNPQQDWNCRCTAIAVVKF